MDRKDARSGVFYGCGRDVWVQDGFASFDKGVLVLLKLDSKVLEDVGVGEPLLHTRDQSFAALGSLGVSVARPAEVLKQLDLPGPVPVELQSMTTRWRTPAHSAIDLRDPTNRA